MGSERRPARGASLRRCASLLGCFNGVQDIYEPVTSMEEAMARPRKPPVTALQLGSQPPSGCLSFASAVKAKEACGQALEAAKKGSPHIRELFAGAQLFMQVEPSKLGPRPYRHRVSPSIGFLPMTTSRSMDSSLPDR